MTIYLIVHYALDGDLVEWECHERIAFTSREKAEEFVKTHKEMKYDIDEIELL